MSTLEGQYQPKKHEEQVYHRWEEAGLFAPSEKALQAGKKPFVIVLPPPNITGNLHMGHALQDTIMDVLVRWHRMLGEPTLWLPGTDHAALPTNRIIEKQLKAEGLTKEKVGREEFLRRSRAWYEKTGSQIINQMKRLGASCDWTRLTFTMDPKYVLAVQEAFVQYYNRGLIYRGDRIVNWCLHCGSVISDLEIQHQERTDKLFYFRYPLASNPQAHIPVATTRPETMLGDTAVAVHPQDGRYKSLVGKEILLPFTARRIPIIADEAIDPAFGTGAVKVTPAHDIMDAQIGQRHNLPIINVISESGKMNEHVPEGYRELSLVQAREKILEDLQAAGLMEKIEDIKHAVNVCERCGTVIEPLISRQWFVDMSQLKEETIQVTNRNSVQFYPSRWKQHVLDWMDEVHDWTISRQIWLGQQIPVWWKKGARGTNAEAGSYVVALEKPSGDWEQDPDVLDTWFSSAIWPLATLGWPQATSDLQRFYPTSVLVTGRDILYLWVVRMIFSGLELLKDPKFNKPALEDRIPFQSVLIHPTVLTKSGQRMSKSLGTGIDPLELIEAHGADATRFGLLYQMNYDRQAIRFDEAAIASARNFANKLWNIAKLLKQLPERSQRSVADDWIEERTAHVTAEVTELLASYRLGEAVRLLYDLIWKEYADWYVEIVKTEGSTQVAQEVFLTLLRLIHPFMPHITEVLWEELGEKDFIAQASWPQAVPAGNSSNVEIKQFQEAVTVIRSARKMLGIRPNITIEVVIPRDTPLQAALAALTKAQIVVEPSYKSVRFNLPSGQKIIVASEEITGESLATTRRRLEGERTKLQERGVMQQQILEQMRGKAPAENISQKEVELKNIQQEISAAENSLQLLAE